MATQNVTFSLGMPTEVMNEADARMMFLENVVCETLQLKAVHPSWTPEDIAEALTTRFGYDKEESSADG